MSIDTIGPTAAAPAIARIAELESAVIRQAKEITRLRLLLTIIEPEDTLVRLPDGCEIQADEQLWAEAVNILLTKHGEDFHDILDDLGTSLYLGGA